MQKNNPKITRLDVKSPLVCAIYLCNRNFYTSLKCGLDDIAEINKEENKEV